MGDAVAHPAGRAEQARLSALRHAGLSASADTGMERFARLVSNVLGVPVAMVSLAEPGRHVFPGLVGLGEPWTSTRSTPASRSLCRHVVVSGEPLVIPDIGADDRWRAHPVASDLGAAAYVGMPLTDSGGNILGTLCAIDTRPRDWTEAHLRDLADLAAACSTELSLRIVSRAEEALARSELLLRAAEDLADTIGLVEVRRRVRELVTSDLKPSYVGLILTEGNRLRRLVDPDGPTDMELDYETYDLDDAWPTARAARDNTTIVVQGIGDLVAGGYSDDAIAAFTSLGLHSAICVPLPGDRSPLGTLVIGWNSDHHLDVLERAVVTVLAGYTARAVQRALFVEDRIVIARRLQQAMLTDLPEVDGIELAALYRPASAGDLVGGDWYDAYLLPSATLAVTIGDITGHDIHATTLMGQLRSMLRQADLDHQGTGPAHVVHALERANKALGIAASGTLVHAHLRPTKAGSWEMAWANAGHPPLLLRHPDGRVSRLSGRDVLIHPALMPAQRTAHTVALQPGSVVLLYTDGLVEHRGHDIHAAISTTADLLGEHAELPLPQLLEVIVDQVGGREPDDDIALLVIRC